MHFKRNLLLVFLLWPAFLYSQDTLKITKAEALAKMQKGNYQLKVNREQELSARADYHQSMATFLPTVSASHTAMLTTNPLMSFGFKLNQEIVGQADFNPALLNDPDGIRDYMTKVEVLQPLFNLDGIYGRSAAKSQWEAYQLQSARSRQAYEMQTEQTYLQLQLAYKALGVLSKARITAHENEQLAENFLKQGYLQQADLLAIQIRVQETEQQYTEALTNVRNTSDYLRLMMGEEKNGSVYFPADISDTLVSQVPADTALNHNRADLRAVALAENAWKNMLRKERGALLPRLNAFGWYELHDDVLFGTEANGYLLGASLSWKIFDGYSGFGKVEKAKAEYHKAALEHEQYTAQSQLELHKAQRALIDAAQAVKLARLSFQQSQEAYRIRQNRFRQGLEKVTDLLMAETMSSVKELELQQAYFKYQVSNLYVNFLSK